MGNRFMLLTLSALWIFLIFIKIPDSFKSYSVSTGYTIPIYSSDCPECDVPTLDVHLFPGGGFKYAYFDEDGVRTDESLLIESKEGFDRLLLYYGYEVVFS